MTSWHCSNNKRQSQENLCYRIGSVFSVTVMTMDHLTFASCLPPARQDTHAECKYLQHLAPGGGAAGVADRQVFLNDIPRKEQKWHSDQSLALCRRPEARPKETGLSQIDPLMLSLSLASSGQCSPSHCTLSGYA